LLRALKYKKNCDVRDTSILAEEFTYGRKSKKVVGYKVATDGIYFLGFEGRVRGTDYLISVQ